MKILLPAVGSFSQIPGLLAFVETPLLFTFVLGLMAVLFAWNHYKQKHENKILGTLEHPFFGMVSQKKDTWECVMSVPGFGTAMKVSSFDGTSPTPVQQATVEWLPEMRAEILVELEKAVEEFEKDTDAALPERPWTLVWDGLVLDADEPRSFCLIFDIEGARPSWGFSAYYQHGVLDEFTDHY